MWQALAVFALVLAPFLITQNALGVLLAIGLDLHPLMGLGGITGGPLAQWLIKRHQLSGPTQPDETSAGAHDSAHEHPLRTIFCRCWRQTLMAVIGG